MRSPFALPRAAVGLVLALLAAAVLIGINETGYVQSTEALYRIDTGLAVDDFVIDEPTRDGLAPQRKPREQLLVCEDGGEMALALLLLAMTLAFAPTLIGRVYSDAFERLPAVFGE